MNALSLSKSAPRMSQGNRDCARLMASIRRWLFPIADGEQSFPVLAVQCQAAMMFERWQEGRNHDFKALAAEPVRGIP
jgi:hypothetical protein